MIIHILKQWQSYLISTLSILLHWVLFTYASVWIIVGSLAAFWVCAGVLFWYKYRTDVHRWRYLCGGLCILLGSFGLLFLVEARGHKILLSLLHTILFGLYMYVPARLTAQLAHEFKPWRRILTVLITYGLFGVVSSIYGLSLFFQFKTFFWSALVIGAIAGALSLFVLRLYYEAQRVLIEWSIVIGILMFEYAIALSYTSFGYLSLGVLFSWLWYGILVFTRFHISPKGIDWSKQRVFIGTTIVFFILILYTTRWL